VLSIATIRFAESIQPGMVYGPAGDQAHEPKQTWANAKACAGRPSATYQAITGCRTPGGPSGLLERFGTGLTVDLHRMSVV